MSERPAPKEFSLADEERVVRTYACTRFYRLLGPPATGYLTVTNRRLVYHCEAKSLVGRSNTVVEEMPLDDVGGISSAVAVSVNLILVAIFAAILFVAVRLALAILPDWMTSWVVLILLALPYLLGLLINKGVISQDLLQKTTQSLEGNPVWGYLRRRDAQFYMGLFHTVFLAVLLLGAGRVAFESRLGVGLLGNAFLIAACLWVYRSAIRRFLSFSLKVTARSSHSAGILIPGQGLLQVLRGHGAELRSLWASPAEDAERLVHELGALLTDVRLLGDLGLAKWTDEPAPAEA